LKSPMSGTFTSTIVINVLLGCSQSTMRRKSASSDAK
jgi:hypothetical protein